MKGARGKLQLHHANCDSNHYDLLGAFRGGAILWIVCFHILANCREQYGSFLNFIIQHGSLGVPIFFVISGYCTGLSVDKLELSGGKPVKFLAKRIKRIYLTYWLHLIFVAALLPIAIATIITIWQWTKCGAL